MPVSDEGVFFVFSDASRGRETYGAGCFLKVPAAARELAAVRRAGGRQEMGRGDLGTGFITACQRLALRLDQMLQDRHQRGGGHTQHEHAV